MKIVKTGEWKGLNDKDIVFFLKNQEVETLKKESLTGELFNKDFPYDSLNEKVILRLANIGERTTAWGGGSNAERTEFFIKTIIYQRLNENGRALEVRYDTQGNAMDIINYNKEKGCYTLLMQSLGLVK